MASADQFGDTVQAFRAAAAEPALWAGALHALEELTGSAGAVLGLIPRRADVRGFNISGRFTAEQCADYTENYMPVCARTAFITRHPEILIYHDAMIIDEAAMDRDPVYDWFGKNGLRYFTGTLLPATEDYLPLLTLQRSRRQGHAEKADLDLLARLRPHLAQAVALANYVGSLPTPRRLSLAVLDLLPQAAFILNADGAVIVMNRPAERLLRTGEMLVGSGGVLRCREGLRQAPFERLVSHAVSPGAGGAGGWISLERPSGHLPYAILVSPLMPSDASPLEADAAAIVLVHDPERRPSPDKGMLARVYGLTEAEAGLARALAVGHSLSSAAALHRIGFETARTHLRSIFRKMNVTRQQDLIRVLGQLR